MKQIYGRFEGLAVNIPVSSVALSRSPNSSHQLVPLGVSHNYDQHVPTHFMHSLCCWAIGSTSLADPRDSVQFSRYGDCAQDIDSAHCQYSAVAALPNVYDSGRYHPDVRDSLTELLAVLAESPTRKDKPNVMSEPSIVGRDDEESTALGDIESLEENWKLHECEPPPYTDKVSRVKIGDKWGGGVLLCCESDFTQETRGAARNGGRETGTRNWGGGVSDSKVAVSSREMELGQETKEEADVGTIVKQMKAEERKIRNRASAHRSNQRKRAVKAALEIELYRERRKVCELRLKEKMLLEENRRLRQVRY